MPSHTTMVDALKIRSRNLVLACSLFMTVCLISSNASADTAECDFSEVIGVSAIVIGGGLYIGLAVPSMFYLVKGKGSEVERIALGVPLIAAGVGMTLAAVFGYLWYSDCYYKSGAGKDLAIANGIIGGAAIGLGVVDLISFSKKEKIKVAFVPNVMRDRFNQLIPGVGAVMVF
ncbi:MAG: hypothetical protein GY762_14420 [Proteobacteria bacterium]|nr:hypothetical protein [Pseudomonadota bacterium]